MTTLTLLTAVICIFALPALGSSPNNNYPYGRHPSRPYPFRSNPFRSNPFRSNPRQGSPPYPTYPAYPFTTRGYPFVAPTTTESPGSRGTKDQSRGGRGDQGGKGGKGQDRPNPPDAVAFSGNRKTAQYFFQQGPVIFNDVTTNIGGGYNSDYGVFTAFDSGIYLVNYNVVSPRKGVKRASVDLFRNKEIINSASGSGRSGETSNSAVLFLNHYDQLSVQGRAESAVFCGHGRNDAFCSFNVVLLKIGVFSDPKVARPVPGW